MKYVSYVAFDNRIIVSTYDLNQKTVAKQPEDCPLLFFYYSKSNETIGISFLSPQLSIGISTRASKYSPTVT